MGKGSFNLGVTDTLLQRLIQICCCVLMFSDVAAVSLVEKSAYIGQAAELVSNIDSHYEDPALYYENGTYITSWKGNTAEPSDCHYVGKFHMDDKRNIWILRVESEDEGNYVVRFGAKHKRHDVHILLTVKEQIFAYIGQAVKLFNIDHDHSDPSLYNETQTLIALWKGTTNIVVYMNPHYRGTIYMDKERNIWIFDVERKNAGRYYVKFGSNLERYEVSTILTVKEKLSSEPKQSWQAHEYTSVPTEGSENSNFLITELLLALLVILSSDIILKNKTYIGDGYIAMKRWIQETLWSEHIMIPRQSTQPPVCTSVMETVDGSEFTEHMVQNYLEQHPEYFENKDFMKKSLILTRRPSKTRQYIQ